MRWGTLLAIFLFTLRIYSASVTVVTHGLDSNAQTWVLDMCRDIQAYQDRLDYESDVYRVTLPQQNMVLSDPQFDIVQDTFTSTDASKNVIVAFDWSYYSKSVIAGIGIQHATWTISPYLASFLLKSNALPSIPEPLASRSIHLIGHSRGGSLISGAGDILATNNVTIGHFTTLDPRAYPLSNDTHPHVPPNVMFADNYFQTYDILTYGDYVEGAYNRKPILFDTYILAGALPLPIVADGHKNVHTWYHRTINTELPIPGDDIHQNLYEQWFATNENDGALTGYYFQHCPYGIRPADGYRARRLKRPELALTVSFQNDEVAFSSSGDATGRYFIETSTNLTSGWFASTNSIIFDGRPFSVNFSPIPPLLFLKLISTEPQF